MYKFAILTDSGSDVPTEYIQKYPVYVAPLSIIYKDGTSYLDGVEISAEEVTRRFAQEIPSTSLPTIEQIKDTVDKIVADGYDSIMVVTISSGLSGTFNAMRIVAEDYPDLTWSLVDTLNIGVGAGMVAAYACQLLEAGLSIEEADPKVQAIVPGTKVFFCIPTLDYLRKGGRIGLVTSFVGTALGLRPIITCNEEGIYDTVGKGRGWSKAVETAKELAVKFRGDSPRYNLAVAHSDAESEARDILTDMQKRLPDATAHFFGIISPALTVHTGPGLIGIGIQRLP